MFVQKYNTPKQYSNLFMSSDGIYLTGLWWWNEK